MVFVYRRNLTQPETTVPSHPYFSSKGKKARKGCAPQILGDPETLALCYNSHTDGGENPLKSSRSWEWLKAKAGGASSGVNAMGAEGQLYHSQVQNICPHCLGTHDTYNFPLKA